MFSFYLILFVITIIILLFSLPYFSPVPYFPSQPIDMPLIINALNLKNNQIIIDLGAGDGIVIFKAADAALRKKLNTQFVAVEINPILILVLYIRRLFHPNRKNIKIILDDIFKMNFSPLVPSPQSLTVYLYVSPWLIEKIILNIKSQISKYSVVSYMYPVKSLARKPSFAKASKGNEIIKGKNKIFIY